MPGSQPKSWHCIHFYKMLNFINEYWSPNFASKLAFGNLVLGIGFSYSQHSKPALLEWLVFL
ncbi:hypothetical protein N836_33790 [Leptolyngbya sp. Heron Island J]|nr:hypothetical protein N836_33790 [Leptolyngbya sp. Heron Island J]